MPISLTVEEVRAKHLAAMPAPLGKLFDDLSNQVCWLHTKWSEFLFLYGQSEKTVAILNEAAPQFAYDLQHMMWESIFLHIFRLTDRPQVCGKETLTLLRQLLDAVDYDELQSNVNTLIEKLLQKAEFAH